MIPFVKMHGLGNDFVVVDAFQDMRASPGRETTWPQLARAICERRLGVGADQLLLLERASPGARAAGAAMRMRVWNADGGDCEMCGNGIRCVVRLALERGHAAPRDGVVLVETGAGLIACEPRFNEGGRLDAVTVNMGAPSFGPDAVHAKVSQLRPGDRPGAWRVGDFEGELVSIGNPHLVVFTPEPADRVDLARIGPMLERHDAFPERINVQFAHATSPAAANMRTWERGAGLTSACGTGACAVLAAGVRMGLMARDATLRLPGGELHVRWDESSGRLFKTGPATLVFEGEWRGESA